jgi:hypothetical protein
MAYNNGMKKYDGMKMDHGMKQSKKEAMKEARGEGIDMGSMSDGNAMKKTGIYQDRENGMLKNHGMLKDLGMLQEEGMRGMRKMRGVHQTDEEIRKEMEADKGKPISMKTRQTTKGASAYAGEPIDISFGGKSMRVSGVKPYTKPSGSTGYTVNRPSKGAYGIEVPKGSEQYAAIQKTLYGEYPKVKK